MSGLACYLIGGSLVFRSYMLTIRVCSRGWSISAADSLIVLADRGLLLVFRLWRRCSPGTGLRGLTIAFVPAPRRRAGGGR